MCGVMEETSAHILCECEALASLRHAYLGSFFLEPKDIQSISLGAIWSFSKASGLPWLDMGHKGPALRPRCIGAVRSRTLDMLILILNNSVSDSHYTTYNATMNNKMGRMWSRPNKCTLLESAWWKTSISTFRIDTASKHKSSMLLLCQPVQLPWHNLVI